MFRGGNTDTIVIVVVSVSDGSISTHTGYIYE